MGSKMKRTLIAGGAVVVTVVAGTGAALAQSSGGDSDDGTEVPITGDALERASAAALDHTGEGRVTETEEGDEESYYEVEVTLDNGREVDVQLNEQFEVVGQDIEGPGGDSD